MVFRKSKVETTNTRGQVGVALFDDGIAIAHVTRLPSAPASLEHVEYRSISAPEKQLETLKAMIDDAHLTGIRTVLVLNQKTYHFFLVEEPKVDAAALALSVRFCIKDYLDYPLDDAIVDYIQVPQEGATERARMLYVVAAKRARIDESASIVQESGASLQVIDGMECALRNVLREIAEEGPRALLILRPDDVSVMMVANTRIYMMRHLEVDTSALWVSGPGDELARGRTYLELGRELQRSLEYCNANLYQQRPLEILVTPVQDEDTELLTSIEQQLGICARYIDVNECLKMKKSLTRKEQSNLLEAIGGALRNEELSI